MNLLEQFNAHRETLAGSGGAAPWLLVFDVDSTLMDTEGRNRAILEAALRDIPGLGPAAETLRAASSGWNVVEPARRLGTVGENDLARFADYWRERFFSNEWLLHERPYPGVAEFLQALKARGFTLVYLTGRHAGGMDAGTRESFLRHGLPAGESETFFFKPRIEDEDAAFKRAACAEIARLGTVVGSLDNEPANVNLLARAFPRARHVWMRTITSPVPDPLLAGIPETTPDGFRLIGKVSG